ncbi:hypothetical protein ES705_04039 [subsurface metagenome]
MVKFFKKIRKKFSRFSLLVSDFKPILLSHHPNCDHFPSYVYHIGKYKFCIGCFTLYPFILITIILTLLLVELNSYNLVMLLLFSFSKRSTNELPSLITFKMFTGKESSIRYISKHHKDERK